MQEMKSSGAAARSSISARSRGLSVDAKRGSVSRSRSRAIAVWCSGPAYRTVVAAMRREHLVEVGEEAARAIAASIKRPSGHTIGSSCEKARPCDRSNASIAAPVDGFAWLIIAGSQSAAATSPDRNFRSSASASARACALLSPSPSLVFQCLQGDVSCGHNVVITLTSKGHRQIDARKYSPSGDVGLRPLTSMPMLSTLGHLGGDLLRLRLGWRWDQCEPLENSLSALALGAFDYSCCFGFACARHRLLFLVCQSLATAWRCSRVNSRPTLLAKGK